MANSLEKAELIHRLRRPVGPWRDVVVHESTGSTNDDAIARAEPYLLVVAAEQTAGRGRRARAWSSPPGTSVSVSMVLPLDGDACGTRRRRTRTVTRDPGWVPLAVGLGVRDALTELVRDASAASAGSGSSFVLKWPNDVLALGAAATSSPAVASGEAPAKIAGILCQMVPGEPLVVAGVGVNVTVPVEALPAPVGITSPATSLHLCVGGGPLSRVDELEDTAAISREDVVVAVCEAVASRHRQWLSGGADLDELRWDYRDRCATLGTWVDVHLPGDRIRRALATGIGEGGTLETVDSAGSADSIRAGDVIHIRPGPGA